jgi:hypothetical protein
MPTEAGDLKLLGNYRKLIDQVSAEANYNPANADITTARLESHYTDALAPWNRARTPTWNSFNESNVCARLQRANR